MFRNIRVTVEQRHFLMLIRHCTKWRAVDPHCAKRKRKGKKVKEIKDMTSVKNRFIESKRKRKKKKYVVMVTEGNSKFKILEMIEF